MIRETRSVCPVCLANIPAVLDQRPDGSVVMTKTCPQHGTWETTVWRGRLPFSRWISGTAPLAGSEGLHCPEACGLCSEHVQGSCCVVLEVTERCNLRCRFCFADAGKNSEPPLTELLDAVQNIAHTASRPMLQLSGGEPTLRNDLPDLIRAAREAGIPYVQVNTNGIRLAQEPDLAQALADAGLNFVFLQFDGTDDRIYRTLRGRSMLEIKEKAIANSGAAGLGVTLVPTVVPGVNLRILGDIVKYAADRSPVVRGVHFQPVSYFGRVPENGPVSPEHCTMDELLASLCEQTGLVFTDFVPSRCDHPLCGFHGSFIAEKGLLIPLTHGNAAPRTMITAGENREFVAKHWLRQNTELKAENASVHTPEQYTAASCRAVNHPLRLPMENSDVTDMDVFLRKVRSQSFTVSCMPFQDAMNLDAERLRNCSLHVYRKGKLVPLCAEYLTPVDPAGRKEEQQ
ncbi:MAG: radical SAM protein [Solobacterium sp.]|nr:radical SAM protein [Solobacterium sp.]